MDEENAGAIVRLTGLGGHLFTEGTPDPHRKPSVMVQLANYEIESLYSCLNTISNHALVLRVRWTRYKLYMVP